MNDKIEKEVITLPPFKKFCMTIGELPSSYLETMTYYEMLVWFTKYLQDTVIPTINNNGEAVEELQNKYIEFTNNLTERQENYEEEVMTLFNNLQDFVNNYFENLDVQQEINNKLDEMVEDGTFNEIINQEIFSQLNNDITEAKNNIGDIANLETIKKDNLVNAINSLDNNYIYKLRKKYNNNYENFNLPVSNQFFNNVTILKDKFKGNYKYIFNPLNYKLNSSNTYYVNPNSTESSSTMDGSIEHPFNNIVKALNIMVDNDTLVLMPGIYRRNNFNIPNASSINISCNILIQGTKENTLLTNSDVLSWSQNATYNNVYQANRTNITNVIDIRGKNEGLFYKLTNVDSIETCSITKNSYYINSGIIYVNIGEEVTNEKVICNLSSGFSPIKLIPSNSNKNYYIENLMCLSGDYNIISISNNGNYIPTVIANNCDFLFANGTDVNAISVKGANTIFYKCKACYGSRDGFNYHSNSGINCNSIELDCIGSNNGLDESSNNNNGSTTHDGNSILRINGKYFNNKGGNVTDVQTGTKSINIQCVAYDSKSSGTTSNGDFVNQQEGCDMWLYNCYSKGSNSYVNIYGVENTNIYVDNCEYDNAYSDGNIIFS